jgi:hypothetical protein
MRKYKSKSPDFSGLTLHFQNNLAINETAIQDRFILIPKAGVTPAFEVIDLIGN